MECASQKRKKKKQKSYFLRKIMNPRNIPRMKGAVVGLRFAAKTQRGRFTASSDEEDLALNSRFYIFNIVSFSFIFLVYRLS